MGLLASLVARYRAWRKRHIKSLFSVATLERKIARAFNSDSDAEARAILARLDAMGAFCKPENLEGCRLSSKLRAVYLSGGDLEALCRAVDIALRDHRDLDMASETQWRYEPEWPGTRDQIRDAPDGQPAYDQFVAWLKA
jgi:hypothetical protein